MLTSAQEQTARVIFTAEDRTAAGIAAVKSSLQSSEKAAVKSTTAISSAMAQTGKSGAAAATGMRGAFGAAFASVKTGAASAGAAFSSMLGPILAVAAATASLAKAIQFVNTETARLDNFAKSAQKSGLGFDAYQRLSHVATLSGTDINALSKAALKLEVNLRDMAQGGGKQAAEALAELKITPEQLAGLDETERLAVLADAFSNVSNEGTKSALAFELFGKSGTELIPMLNSGSDALRKMSADVGRVFTREELAKAEAYQDALANSARATAQLRGELAVYFAPALTAVLGLLSKVAKGWGLLFAEPERAQRHFDMAVMKSIEGLGRAVGSIEVFGTSVGELTGAVAEHVPFVDEATDAWNNYFDSLKDKKLGEFTTVFSNYIGTLKTSAALLAATSTDHTEGLTKEVAALEHQTRLAEAQGKSAKELEVFYRQQHEAKVLLYKTTKDTAALEAEMANEQIRRASARTAAAKSGGTGPTDADRLKQAGEIQLKIWQDRLAIMEAEAKLSGRSEESAFELASIRRDLAVQQLDLERQTLEITRAKGSLDRERIAARIDAIEREKEILARQDDIALQEESNRLVEEAVKLAEYRIQLDTTAAKRAAELADARLDSEQSLIELQSEAALATERNVFRRIDIERSADAALIQIERARLARAHANAKAEFDAREAAVASMPGGTDEEKLAREDAQKQLMHDRDIERLNYEMDVRRSMEAEKASMLDAEQARREAQIGIITETIGQFESFRSAVESVYGTATQLANEKADAELQATLQSLQARGDAQKAHADAEIAAAKGNAGLQARLRRDQAKREAALQKQIEQTQQAHNEKRKKAEMRYQGAMLMITGAVEAVQAAVSYASLNIPQGIAHTIASVAAFAQGGMLLAGNVPGGGGAGAVAAPVAADASDGSTGNADPSMVPGSTPMAADRDAGTQPSRPVQGGTTIVIQGDITAWGAIDQDVTETLAREIDRVSNSREA